MKIFFKYKSKFLIFLIIFIILINLKTYEYRSAEFNNPVKIEITYLQKVFNFYHRFYKTKKFIKVNFDNINKINNEEKVFKLYKWVKNNIKLVQIEIIDHHHYDIIKRKKGSLDQRSLIFSMLLNYSNIDSFYRCSNFNNTCLNFFYIKNEWHVLDLNKLLNFDKKKKIFINNKLIISNSNLSFFDKKIINEIESFELALRNNTSYIQTPLRRIEFFLKNKF